MKIQKLTIEGIRGVPTVWPIKFGGKSMSIYGQNGRGKSTVADSIELWSSGTIADFHRAGCGLDAAINLEHGPPAKVTVALDDQSTFSRELPGATASEIVREAGTQSPPPQVPILRHKTMSRFMFQSPGDKRKELLPILGLAGLLDFRSELVTAANKAKSLEKSSTAEIARAAEELRLAADEREPLAVANELCKLAGIDVKLPSEKDFLSLDLESEPGAARVVEWVRLVEDLDSAGTALTAAAVDDWNQKSSDRNTVLAAQTLSLLESGRGVLQAWTDDSCPLCLSDYDLTQLRLEIEKRQVTLETAAEALETARGELRVHLQALRTLRTALSALLAEKPIGDWPGREKLEEMGTRLDSHLDSLAEIDKSPRPVSTIALPGFDELIEQLKIAATTAAKSSAGPALARLVRLRIALKNARDSEARNESEKTLSDGLNKLLEIANQEIRSGVESSISEISEKTAEYFGRLVHSRVYGNLKLEYDDRRQGGLEFELTYKDLTPIRPPQRIVSESQLNALGIALFLARCSVAETCWQTLVLDDVVNSFDADHRMSLASVLADDFAEWQVIFLTHDRAFERFARDILPTWQFTRIAKWTPEHGPLLDTDDLVARLESELNQGVEIESLGTLARLALESSLEKIIHRLGFPIRYDRRQSYAANELISAIENGLASRGSSIATAQILGSIKASNYLTILTSHDRFQDPVPSESDLRQMILDLRSLGTEFECDQCGTKAWNKQVQQIPAIAFECQCGELAA